MLNTAMHSSWGRIALAVFGAFIYAVGINLFVVPLGLITSGAVGLCQLIRSLIMKMMGIESMTFDIAGILLYIFNIPMFFIAYRYMGKIFFRNTLICATAYTVFMSIIPIPAAPVVDDVLTSCLIGGVIAGVGTGLALTSGCCGGGLDLLGLYLAKRGAKVTIGRFNLAFNAVLFATCGVLFDLTTLIYSVLNTIFNAMAIDRAHRQSVTVQVLIFTKKDGDEVDRFIIDNLHRGITRWEGKGVYTGEATHILCVCMNKYEIDDLRDALGRIDPKAFFIVQEGVHVSTNFERRLS